MKFEGAKPMRHSHKRIEEARRAPDAGDNRQFLSNAGRKGGRVTAQRTA